MIRKQKRVYSENTEPSLVNEEPLSGSNPPTLANKYWCGCCNFSAKTPSGFRNHLYSNRHYRNWSKHMPVKDDGPVSSSIDAGIASNDIIYLLDEMDSSSFGVRSDTVPKLVMTELDDIESNADTSSHYTESESESESEFASDDSEYASDSENDNNMEIDEDIDLPLYGTGLFYPEVSHGGSASSRTLKYEKSDDMPDPLFMATAFVLGMVAERCYSQFVRNLCAC